MDVASWVGAGVAVAGALVALVFLPTGMRVGAETPTPSLDPDDLGADVLAG